MGEQTVRKTDREKLLSAKANRYIFCYCFVAIAVAHFVIFYAIVNFNSILMAFRQYKGIENQKEIYEWGFGNFARIFNDIKNVDSPLRYGFFNTLKFFGVGLLTIPISIVISYFLYKKISGYKTFRVIFFLPSIISAVVYVGIFKNMISMYGPVFTLIEKIFGYQMPSLLNNDATATPTIIFFTFWTGLAGGIILYQGAMNRLPEEVIEAGELDGISWIRELWSVVIPMIWPTMSMMIVLAFTGIFSSGGPILLFTDTMTAARNSMMTIPYYIFSLTYNNQMYEYPAAIGLLFTVVSIPVVFGIRWLMSKVDPEVEY